MIFSHVFDKLFYMERIIFFMPNIRARIKRVVVDSSYLGIRHFTDTVTVFVKYLLRTGLLDEFKLIYKIFLLVKHELVCWALKIWREKIFLGWSLASFDTICVHSHDAPCCQMRSVKDNCWVTYSLIWGWRGFGTNLKGILWHFSDR